MHPKPPKRPLLTHFLCLPLSTPSSKPQWQSSFQTFAKDVHAQGLNPEAIPSVDMLHLTLGVMSLTTEDKKTAACVLLKGEEVRRLVWKSAGFCYEGEDGQGSSTHQDSSGLDKSEEPNLEAVLSTQQHLDAENSSGTAPSSHQQPLHNDHVYGNQSSTSLPVPASPSSPYITSLSGLHTTRIPASTSTLYASPSPLMSPLHTLCQSLRELFLHANLLVPESRPLLLHATVFNTLYCAKKPEKEKKINAKALMEKWEQRRWVGDIKVARVAIWEMGAKVDVKDECRRYRELEGIDLP